MSGERRRGFIGWLSGAFRKSDDEAPPADAAPDTADTSSVNADEAAPDGRSDILMDIFGDEESTFVPPARPTVRPVTSEPSPSRRQVIRPPGAIAAFESTCTRCGLCVEACPIDAINVGKADGLPTLVPHLRPCELCADVPCATACPEGALLPIKAATIHLGTVEVLPRLCLNTFAAESCERCLDQCPIPDALTAGDKGIPEVDGDLCVGCGLCARSCPAEPRAMLVRPSPNPHHPRPPEPSKDQ